MSLFLKCILVTGSICFGWPVIVCGSAVPDILPIDPTLPYHKHLVEGIDIICPEHRSSNIVVLYYDELATSYPSFSGLSRWIPITLQNAAEKKISMALNTKCVIEFFNGTDALKVVNRQYALSVIRIFVFPESDLEHFLSLTSSITTCIPYMYAYNPLTFHGSWIIYQSAGITWTLAEFLSFNRSMRGYEIVYLTMDFLRDITYDLEIGKTIAQRHNATFNRLMELIPKKCVDYYYNPMYGGNAQFVPLPEKSELCFIVPKSAPKSVFLVLLDPYDRFSWIVFGLTVVALSMVLFWFAESSRYTSVLLIVLEMLMIVLNGPTHRLVDRFERFAVGLFMLLSIVVISGYQSLVISFMSSPRYDPQLDTFDAINETCLFIYDIHLKNIGYNFKNVHHTYEVFESTELMWQVKLCSLVSCTEAAYIMAHVSDVDEPIQIDPGEIELYNEEEWKQMKHHLQYFRYSKARVQSMTAMYLVAQDSPVRHHLARYTQAFIEGRLEYFPVLKKRKPKPRIILDDTLDTISVRQMDMKALLIAWILYCAGIVLSTVSFIAEQALVCMRKMKRIVLDKYNKRRKCNKSFRYY